MAQMARPESCSQPSPNRFVAAHDLSLIGRDVAKGETVAIPIRMTIRRSRTPQDTLTDYEAFLRERA